MTEMTDIVSMTDERAMKRDVAGRIGLAVVTLLATVAAGPLAGQGVPELRIERAEGAVDGRTPDLEMGFSAGPPTLFEELGWAVAGGRGALAMGGPHGGRDLPTTAGRSRLPTGLLRCLLLGAGGAGTSGPPGISIEEWCLPVPSLFEWAPLGAPAYGAVVHNHVLFLGAVR